MVDFDRAYSKIRELYNEVSKVIIGKRETLESIIATLIAEGHVLIDGPPGVAKTLMAKSLARAIGGVFKRIQGNPDILPTDITGYHIYTLDGGSRLVKGPIFANVVMVDELNRIPSRSQAALLQAMQEGYVTIDGVDYNLPKPFIIIATMVRTGREVGTYPITETLIDRFAVTIHTIYNPPDEEFNIIDRSDELVETRVEKVIALEELTSLIKFVRENIYVDGRIIKYIVDLANYIRKNNYVLYGPSHRGGIYLYRIARVYALMNKRDYVIPDDIKRFAVETLAHRLILSHEAELEGITPESIVMEALKNIAVPKE